MEVSTSTQKEQNQNITIVNNTGLTNKLLDLKQTKIVITNFKQWEADEIETTISRKEMKRNEIIFLAQVFENKFKDEGLELLTDQICTYINQIFEINDLSKYSYLILETLPEKYKDRRGRSLKNIEGRIERNRLSKNYHDIINVDISKVDSDSLKQFYDNNLNIANRIKSEMMTRGIVPTNTIPQFSQQELENPSSIGDSEMSLFDNESYIDQDSPTNDHYTETNMSKENDQGQESKFATAKVGEPLSTPEKLCQEIEGYAEQYALLDKAMQHSIKIATVNYEWFVKKYPPLSLEDCKNLTNAVMVFNKLMLPFADRKYRRDHYQMLKIICHKVIQTSVKASRESRIPCGHHFDKKTGLPIFREMTKEQIDATYVSEFNYILRLFNAMFGWYQTFSKVNESHGGRCMEDRAVDLHSVLEFHA